MPGDWNGDNQKQNAAVEPTFIVKKSAGKKIMVQKVRESPYDKNGDAVPAVKNTPLRTVQRMVQSQTTMNNNNQPQRTSKQSLYCGRAPLWLPKTAILGHWGALWPKIWFSSGVVLMRTIARNTRGRSVTLPTVDTR